MSKDYWTVKVGGKKIEIQPFTPPKFDVEDPRGYQYLEENGYAVFTNVATPEELSQGIELFWKYMNNAFPNIKRDDISTWKEENWPKWGATGIIESSGIGQSEFLWFNRGLPKVKKIFSNIWNDEELLVSFDAAGMTRPPEYNKDWITRGGWFHFDQNGYAKPGRHCVQGLLNYLPAGSLDGGFVVVPRTHFAFNKMYSEPNLKLGNEFTSDFVPLTKPGVAPEIWDDPQYSAVKLNVDPGDFVLWDSRTAHCNHPAFPNPNPAVMPKDLRRLVAYVCMTPFKSAKDKKQLQRDRMDALRDGLTTSHWPHHYQPRGLPSNKQPEFFLDSHQKSLLMGTDKHKLGDGPLSTKNVPYLY